LTGNTKAKNISTPEMAELMNAKESFFQNIQQQKNPLDCLEWNSMIFLHFD